MDASGIIESLKNLGISIKSDGDKLLLRPGSRVPLEMVSEIRRHKGEILAWVSNACACNPLPTQAHYGAMAQAGCGPKYQQCDVCGYTWRCKICGGCRRCRFPG